VTTQTKAPDGADTGAAASGVVIPNEAVAAFAAMAASIPEAGDGGFEGILAQLLVTADPAALDAPWRSDGLTEYLDRRLVIQGLRRMESEFDSGLPFFLIVQAADLETGEVVTLTTGAVSVVAQLTRAWDLGLIPGWRVIPRQADRPSKSGYYPQHPEVMRGRLAAEG
jgi:hypothetical protein